MTDSSEDKVPGLELEPPMHPGLIMKLFLLPHHELELEAVSVKSGLSLVWLRGFASGNAEMTSDMQPQLRNVFGEAADSLYRMQLTYNYYQAHGQWPTQYGLRK